MNKLKIKAWKKEKGREKNRKIDQYRWLEQAGEKLDEELKKASGAFRKNAVLAAAGILALLVVSYIGSGSGQTPASLLIRGDYGSDVRDIVINAEIRDGDQSLEKELSLKVKPRTISQEEASSLFEQCGQWLGEEVINSDQICKDLELPLEYGDGLVSLSWHSSDPSRVSEEGVVNLLKLPPACYVTLTATMSAGEYMEDCSFLLHIIEGDLSQSFVRALDWLEQDLSSGEDGERLDLPTEYEGAQVLWDFPGKSVSWELIPVGGLLILALYFGRFDAVERRLKREARQLEYEIPSMTLQLILLLNAGLVLSAAFDQLIAQNADSDHPLYRSLRAIDRRCKAENLSFPDQLSLFARRSGCRDFIRIASLIADHSSRGSELASKLEQERDRLWSGRLAMAKARTKEAETKLCIPLMLLLLVLVVISAAPALMTM